MQTIRLSLNKNLEETFEILEKEMKPLSRTEIIKVALAEMFQKIRKDEPIYYLTEEEEESLDKAMKSKKVRVDPSKKGEIEKFLNS